MVYVTFSACVAGVADGTADGGDVRPPPPDDGERPPRPDDGDRDGDRDGGDRGGADDPSQPGYFVGGAYQAMSAVDKLDDLWSMCESNNQVADQRWAEIPTLFTQNMNTSFQGGRDEMPRGRFKINHSQGVVAKVSWEDQGNHSYTGLYDGGSDLGLIRLSEGNFLLPGDETPGLTPTLAVKFLRDGMDSVNLLANTSFEPIDSFNFFAADFRSHIPSFRDQCLEDTIERKFIEATREIGALGLSEFARFNTNGQPASGLNFPFNLWFEPNQDLRDLWPENRQFDATGREIPFYEQLQQIPIDSVLFEVWAQDIPNDPRRLGRPPLVQHIANIRATSDTITSLFGDERLFFQHERKRDDFDLRPEWRNYVEALNPNDAWDNTPIPFWPND